MNSPRPSRNTRRSQPRGFRLAANVMEEEAWHDDSAPNMRLSRAFVVVLILHIVAVGGLLAFKHFGREKPASNQTAAKPSAAPSVKAPLPEIVRATPVEATVTVTVDADMPVSVFAEQRQISVEKLRELNKDLPPSALFRGAKVVVPASAATPKTIAELPVAKQVNPSAPVALATPTPAAVTTTPPVQPHQVPSQSPSLPAARQPAPVPEPTAATPARQTPRETYADRQASRREPSRIDRTPAKPAKPKVADKPAAKPKPAGRTHRVQAGDNLFRLAKRYNVSEDALMRANGIKDPTRVPVGKVLSIPAR